jgi:hypothetical protein
MGRAERIGKPRKREKKGKMGEELDQAGEQDQGGERTRGHPLDTMLDDRLVRSAEKITREIMRVNEKDRVLVLTDEAKLTVAKAFFLVCRDIGAETVLAIMPLEGQHRE